ncbi:transposase [Gordonia otitidis]|uniref:Transposase n=1 Tax=Gordonia otitidis (strain DSM 44809 / CCUG 52243 / JCM 12355 / NBRC 100426 / IFM 10032) TaxID=1108044 RepID=H5TIG7_GORO1|nr:transposase [Gordonia otitidis]GAB33275.1 putative transposase [Gordonia otitidis NBRC 100426]
MTPALELAAGDKILRNDGLALVVRRLTDGVRIRHQDGTLSDVAFEDLIRTTDWAGEPLVAVRGLPRAWFGLDKSVQDVAWSRMEIVQLVLTGYTEGYPSLARRGEPCYPFDPAHNTSRNERYEEAARLASAEMRHDRRRQRRLFYGELTRDTISKNTVRNWVKAFEKDGLMGLVDQRALRGNRAIDRVDPRFRDKVIAILKDFDGDISPVGQQEIIRQARVQLKNEGITDLRLPRNAVAAFVSSQVALLGRTTRSHRTRKLGKVATDKHVLASRPGQIIAIDATRVDNLVWDDYMENSRSIEVLTALDVGCRAVLAQRYVPLGANTLELGLLVYDMMRTFTLEVEGTNIGRWRWTGIPGTIDMRNVTVELGGPLLRKDKIIQGPLDGLHRIPAVKGSVASLDRGSINVSAEFRALALQLGMHLMLNRGGKATDNAHIERFHETIQRGLQQIDGYKGRCVAQRGYIVAEKPLLTLHQLETHMQKWICLDYHRSEHTGIIMPGAPYGRFSPMEAYDILSEPFGPTAAQEYRNLMFQFLPLRWLTIGPSGVEADSNFQYDNRELFSHIEDVNAKGRYRDQDGAAPFGYDRNDITRLWYHHPDTGDVHEIPWKGRDFVNLPMTSRIGEVAAKCVRERGGNAARTPITGRDEIFEQLTEITPRIDPAKWRRDLAAARIRQERSRVDIAETDAILVSSASQPQPGDAESGTRHDDQFDRPASVDAAVIDLAPWEQPWRDYTTREG